jgi:hypothetical protein
LRSSRNWTSCCRRRRHSHCNRDGDKNGNVSMTWTCNRRRQDVMGNSMGQVSIFYFHWHSGVLGGRVTRTTPFGKNLWNWAWEVLKIVKFVLKLCAPPLSPYPGFASAGCRGLTHSVCKHGGQCRSLLSLSVSYGNLNELRVDPRDARDIFFLAPGIPGSSLRW